jgi:hypothetical protein
VRKQIEYKSRPGGNAREGTLRHTSAPARSGPASLFVRFATCVALLTFVGVARAGTLYADRSDDELTQIAAGWEQLTQDERRELLSEVRARMANAREGVENTPEGVANARDGVPMVRIHKQRRYGRIIQQPDGTVVRIERREGTVEYRPLPEDAAGRPFGIGFEHRLGTPTDGGGDPRSASPQIPPALPVEVRPAG